MRLLLGGALDTHGMCPLVDRERENAPPISSMQLY